jgi:hypothetical protein
VQAEQRADALQQGGVRLGAEGLTGLDAHQGGQQAVQLFL